MGKGGERKGRKGKETKGEGKGKGGHPRTKILATALTLTLSLTRICRNRVRLPKGEGLMQRRHNTARQDGKSYKLHSSMH